MLIVPPGVYAIRLFRRGGEDIDIELERDRRSDGHDHFVTQDGRVLPLDVPAVINVAKSLGEAKTYFVDPRLIDRATSRANQLLSSGKVLQRMTAARRAVREIMPDIPASLAKQEADRIRKRLSRLNK